ncbi:UNVERIFIED_ORG: putative acyl esterase [Paraburkholderia sediminicola]|nr:putative acyl esterase [Paraburkholderia sediminicola]
METARETMLIEKDVEIKVRDGLALRANVFRPDAPGVFPVVMAMTIYGKDVHFADAFSMQWNKLLDCYPGLCEDGSSGRHLRWELTDPERWVKDGYVVIAVDARGSGASPGFVDPFSMQETLDYYDAIEWAGVQPWSNGKVGLLGVSYLAIKQWQVAALQPPHLAAIVPWEGASNYYREYVRHGGILSNGFNDAWWFRQIVTNQHGNHDTTHRDRETGLPTTGPMLEQGVLDKNRVDYLAAIRKYQLRDEWMSSRIPDLRRVTVPVLSAGNWGGPGLHLRGNVEGYLNAGSKRKWLSMHVGTHFESFYLPGYVAMQKRFFGRYLKGEENGWESTPPISLVVRSPVSNTMRTDTQWPLTGTVWTHYHLDGVNLRLSTDGVAAEHSCAYESQGDGLTFQTDPFNVETECTGPLMARVWLSSDTDDADVFITLRLLDADGDEVTFIGAHEVVPVARGWLRASQRKLDDARSLPYRPFYCHDEIQKLVPGEPVPLDIEIWPTSIAIPTGYRLAVTVRGRDFEYATAGRLLHTDPVDRAPDVFDTTCRLHTGGKFDSWLLLPEIHR